MTKLSLELIAKFKYVNLKYLYLLLLIILLGGCREEDKKLHSEFIVSSITVKEPMFFNHEESIDTKVWEVGREYLSFLAHDTWGIKKVRIESELVAYVNDTARYRIKQGKNKFTLLREQPIKMQSVDQYVAHLSNIQTGSPNSFFIHNDCYIDSIVLVGSLSDFHIEFFTYELKYDNNKVIVGSESGDSETIDKLLIGDKHGFFDEKYLGFLDENDTIGIVNKIIEFD